MKATASFHEILTEKMSEKTWEPLQGDNSPAHLAHLLGRLKVFRFDPARKAFPRSAPTPKKPRPQGPAHPLSESQRTAKEWFAHQGEPLRDDFTAHELKSAFRRLALCLHPDGAQGSTGAFLELKRHRESLQGLFRNQERA